MIEKEPTALELREAAALARALDGKSADAALPDDGLATAALLRFTRDGGALDAARSEAILTELLAKAKPRRRASWLSWLVPAIALGAILLCIRILGSGPTRLPAPGEALVRAQAMRARPSSAERLATEMRRYRSRVNAALARRYVSALAGCGGADEWIENARAAHRSADDALARGDRDGAIAVLASAAHAPAPGWLDAEDGRVVRQDLYGRLAEIAGEAGRARDARRWAERGLALGDAGDVFGAALHVARGRAREALGDELAAVEDYHRALVIDDALLTKALRAEEEP